MDLKFISNRSILFHMIYCFKLKPTVEIEKVWELLEQVGVQILYSEEDDQGLKQIYGSFPSSLDSNSFLHLPFFEIKQKNHLPEINWQEQWQMHGHHYYDGYVHVDLSEFGFEKQCNPIRLMPGAGFGDVSHPTTKLVLRLMSKHLQEQAVLDIGCGSGILSIAAIAMGSSKAMGLDIDPNALEHARQNVVLNDMGCLIDFLVPATEISNAFSFVLMNMISSEQIVAWNSLKSIHPTIKDVITSGIPSEEESYYLTLTKSWGLTCIEKIELEDWLGFYFKKYPE